MKRVSAFAVLSGLLLATAASAHGGHGGDDMPAARTPTRDSEPRGARERSTPPAANGSKERGDGFAGGAGMARRRIKAAHGGRLTSTSQGYVEVLVAADGAISVWFLDAAGTVLAPGSGGFVTVLGDRPQGLALQADGDHLVGRLGTAQPKTLVVQATVAGRTTTVRSSTAP